MITAVRDRSNTTEFVRALMRNWVPVEATTNSLRTATRDPVNRDADFGSVGENLQNLSTTYAQLPRYLPTLFPARAGPDRLLRDWSRSVLTQHRRYHGHHHWGLAEHRCSRDRHRSDEPRVHRGGAERLCGERSARVRRGSYAIHDAKHWVRCPLGHDRRLLDRPVALNAVEDSWTGGPVHNRCTTGAQQVPVLGTMKKYGGQPVDVRNGP